MSKSSGFSAKQLEREIDKVTQQVAREGKTDAIEDTLDRIEHRIGEFAHSGAPQSAVKRLKDKLDHVK